MSEPVVAFLTGAAALAAVLGLVVFVHEWGHYQVARWFKVRVKSFSIGFGPEVLGWTARDGVRWRLSALPLGGYVSFVGDENAASMPDRSQAKGDPASGLLQDQGPGVRALVALAGPFANFVFSIIVFVLFLLSFGEQIHRPFVSDVQPGGAAEAAGLRTGDLIVSVDGRAIGDFRELQARIMVSGGREVALGVERGGSRLVVNATPRVAPRETPFGDVETQGVLGIASAAGPDTVETIRHNPLSALVRGGEMCGELIATQVRFLAALIRGAMSPGHLSGPLGIGQMAGKVATDSANMAGPEASATEVAGNVVLNLVQLAAALSIAIGFVNLLPLPMLDGGHVVFCAIEAARGRPVSERVQAWSYGLGMACLLSLFVFVTFQDLERAGLFRLLNGAGGAG